MRTIMSETQLSQDDQAKIDLACRSLFNYGYSHFAMIILFNDGTEFMLANQQFCTQDNYGVLLRELYIDRTKNELLSLANVSGDNHHRILCHHTECSFLFMAKQDQSIAKYSELGKITKAQFEKFCIHFVELFLELIIRCNPHFKHAFIFNNKVLRDAVIKGGYVYQHQLTPRETECLWQAAQGKSVKEIARELAISNYTVEQHLRKIRDVFNCNSLIEAIIEGIHRGIIGRLNHFAAFKNG